MFDPNTQTYPYSAVARLVVYWSDGSQHQGTASFIGPNQLVTAAHMFRDQADASTTVTRIVVTPGYEQGEAPFGSFDSKYGGQWEIEWDAFGEGTNGQTTTFNSSFDLGVIGISTDFGHTTGWLGYQFDNSNGAATLVGYGAADHGLQVADTEQANASLISYTYIDPNALPGNSIKTVFVQSLWDISNFYHNPGSSGGPLINSNNQVIGIVSSDHYAARLTDQFPTNTVGPVFPGHPFQSESQVFAQWLTDANAVAHDRTPVVAVNRLLTVYGMPSQTFGNMLTDDQLGKDFVFGASITDVGINGPFADVTPGGVTFSGTYGQLFINQSGTYSYSTFNFGPHTTGTDIFTYWLTDGMGDIANANLVFSIVDPGTVSIGDVAITEGNSGTKTAVFTVTRTGGTADFDINFTTADGTAKVADKDYVGKSDLLHFDIGVMSRTIEITINGDTNVEPDQTFFVNLTGATHGATIDDAQGTGKIINDEPAAQLPLTPTFALSALGSSVAAGGWTSEDQFPRLLGDVNGDGMADIVGFGYAGASVALAAGGGAFGATSFALDAFGAANFGGGWASEDQFPRVLGDVNGDGLADIVGFGYAGATVALATGGGHYATSFFALDAFGAANFGGGWQSEDQFPRVLGDVNGDGMADIVGFGYAGVTVALATGGGHFGTPTFVLNAFGAANFGGGWASQDQFPRALADVNGDGMADIVGFGYAGVTVALATGGGHFADPTFTLNAFGAANFGGGWTSQDKFPRALADLDGDGMADIVGFGIGGVTTALATGGGHFAAPRLAVGAFGSAVTAGGWTSQDLFPRELGDVNGDGYADIVGFGIAGVTEAQLHSFVV